MDDVQFGRGTEDDIKINIDMDTYTGSGFRRLFNTHQPTPERRDEGKTTPRQSTPESARKT